MTPQEFQRRFGEAAQAFQSERFAQCTRLTQRLLQVAPDQPDVHHLLGLSLYRQGKGAEAREALRKAAVKGNAAHIRSLAIVLRELGDRREAISTIEIAGGGRGPLAGLLGILYLEESRLDDAAAALGSAVAQNPSDTEAHINLGIVQERLGRLQRAEDTFRKALALRPDHPGVRVSLARILLDRGYIADASATLEPAAKDPSADVQSLAGAIALEAQDFDKAREHLSAALQSDPDHSVAAINLALLDIALGDWESARDQLTALVAAHPEEATAAVQLAHVQRDLGELAEARTTLEALIKSEPKNANALFERAHLTLMEGDLVKGLADYESRWDVAERKAGRLPPKPTCGRPVWEGKAVDKLVVLGEQGFGDTLMFSRFVRPAAERVSAVQLVCPPELESLLAVTFEGIAEVTTELPQAGHEAGEAELPIMSLPHKMGMDLAAITSFEPWLRVPKTAQDNWQSRLADLSGLRVGLVWSGNPEFVAQGRWLTFDMLEPLFAIPEIDWVSLQLGAPRAEIVDKPARFHDWTDDIQDFADTAAIVAGLDLVITADTAVSHVAGGLGKPFWLLNRFQSEWRWQRHRTDSPWYPTARLFNQSSRGDWAGVVDAVAQALPKLI